MLSRAKKTALGGVALAAMTLLALPTAAFATGDTSGTATVTGGALSMNAPETVDFAATLNGTDQSVQANQALDVLDNTGSAAGWNVTLTSTTFTDDADSVSLADDSVADLSATGACDSNVTCTLADDVVGQSQVAIPAGETAPTAVKILNASAGTGMSGQTWTHVMQLAIPANAHAGTYTSTWTYSLTAGP